MMDLQRASLLLQSSSSTVLATAALPSSLHLPSSHLSGNSFPTAATKPPLLGLARSSSNTTVNPASSASPAVRRHGACSKQLASRRKLRGIRATKSGSADAPDSSASTSSSERGKLLLIATELYFYQIDPRHMKDSWRKVLNSNAENSVGHSSHQNRDGVVLTRFWFLLWRQVHRRNNRTWNCWSAWRRRILQLLLLVSKHHTQSLCPFSPFSLSDSQPVQNTSIAPLFLLWLHQRIHQGSQTGYALAVFLSEILTKDLMPLRWTLIMSYLLSLLHWLLFCGDHLFLCK